MNYVLTLYNPPLRPVDELLDVVREAGKTGLTARVLARLAEVLK